MSRHSPQVLRLALQLPAAMVPAPGSRGHPLPRLHRRSATAQTTAALLWFRPGQMDLLALPVAMAVFRQSCR